MNSFLVAVFANNFLPSNIGGDVIRIRDTAKAAGSKTLATAVVLFDRGLGVLGLAFVAACGSTLAARRSEAIGPLGPSLLWSALLAVLAVVVSGAGGAALVHRAGASAARVSTPTGSISAIATITAALLRFRQAPGAMVAGFGGGIAVQAILVAYYAAVAPAIHLSVPIGHLAILVPVSFIVQMMPLSAERTRCPGGDIRVLPVEDRRSARVGDGAVVHRCRPRHVVLDERRRRLSGAPARLRRVRGRGVIGLQPAELESASSDSSTSRTT